MIRLPELGNKRNRNCVSPVQEEEEKEAADASMCESSNSTNNNNNNGNNNNSSKPTNLVWQQWTATFRASRRLKNDLLFEETIDATVERHMTLMPNKKRSLFEDESDSDDEGNYYKLDVPPPSQQQQLQQRQHPLEFTPSGFLPRLGPQQVTPVSCDPDALPTCSLRRYGHDDEGFGCYDREDRIPPPPSFHRYPSKKRAVGLARPEPQQQDYGTAAPAPAVASVAAAPRFSIGSSLTTEQKEDSIFPPPPPPQLSLAAAAGTIRPPSFGMEIGRQSRTEEEQKTGGDGQSTLFPPPPSLPPPTLRLGGRPNFNSGMMDTLTEEKDATSERQPPAFTANTLRQLITGPGLTREPKEDSQQDADDVGVPLPPSLATQSNFRANLFDKTKGPDASTMNMMMPPPPHALTAATGHNVMPKVATSISQEDESNASPLCD